MTGLQSIRIQGAKTEKGIFPKSTPGDQTLSARSESTDSTTAPWSL